MPAAGVIRSDRHRVNPGGVAGMACLLADGFQGNLNAFRQETIMSTPIPIGREAVEVAQGQGAAGGPARARVCVVGASGKLGRYLLQHALDRGCEVVAVCREVSVDKLEEFAGRITVIPGMTDDREVIGRAVADCDGVLTVLVPRGVPPLLIRNSAGGARLGPSRGSSGVLVRIPHHA